MKKLLTLALLAFAPCAFADYCGIVNAGATDQTVYIRVLDATTGVPNAGRAYNDSGIDLEYVRTGAAATDITEATQTAGGAHSDGGFVSVGHGNYRLDLPDAAVASGVRQVQIQGTITGYVVVACAVDLTPTVNSVQVGSQTASASGTVTFPNATLASTTNITAGTLTTVTTATNVTTVNGLASGVITATSIAADAIGASEVAADVSTELLTGLANLAVNVAQISADSGAADTLETWLDGTAGSAAPLGILDQGTAQSVTATTVVLRSAAAFGDDTLIGATIMACGSTQGYCQSGAITDYVLSTDTATVATWPVTPSGTVTYYVFGTAPSTGGAGLDAAGVRAAVGLASANLDTQLSAIDDYVDTEVAAILVDTGTTLDAALAVVDGNVDAILVDTGTTLDDLVDDLETRLGTPSNLGGGATVAFNLSDIEAQTDDIGAAGAGLTALATQASVTTIDDFLDTEMAAVLADTNELQTDWANGGRLDLLLDGAASAGDPWTTSLPGAYGAGTAGYIMGTNLNATVSSRASQTSLDTVDDLLDSEMPALTTAVADIPTNAELATSQAAADDATLAAVAALTIPTTANIRDIVIEDQGTPVTLGCAISVVLAYAAGDLVTTGSNSTYEDPSGTETRITGNVASAGNRTASVTCPSY